MKTRFLPILLMALCSACGGGGTADGVSALASPPPAPAPPSPPAAPAADNAATYRVTFSTGWDSSSFPTAYPESRHFSGLVGATHDAQIEFWRPGALASVGIERMAEQGSKSALLDEVDAALRSAHAGAALSGGGIGAGASMVTLDFSLTQQYPLVTLVSMVAPSPDWFVGVRGLPLFENGKWRERVTVDLPVWDAGSDDGASYASADIEPTQHHPIELLSTSAASSDFTAGVHRGSGAFLATFTFERIH